LLLVCLLLSGSVVCLLGAPNPLSRGAGTQCGKCVFLAGGEKDVHHPRLGISEAGVQRARATPRI
jgi:hypothetical protein